MVSALFVATPNQGYGRPEPADSRTEVRMRNDREHGTKGDGRSAPSPFPDPLMPSLLFVEDHPLYRSGFRLSLAQAMPTLAVALAESAEDAIAQLESEADFDLCLADERLPGQDGVGFLEAVGRRWPTIARGLLCGDPTPELARRVRAMGCVACLSKARDMDGLAAALAVLFNGGTLFDAEPLASALSEKRRQVLDLAARGKSNKEIARVLGITERTVKDHWSHIFEGLSVTNRAEAVSRAHRLRLI